MNEELLISIIVPVYNVSSYILTCLNSIASQDYKGAMECLIIDDCGTDGSVKIAQQFIEGYDGSIDFRIIYHEKNKGLSGARNTGLKEAKGDYVYFLDSDDWVSVDCISKLTAPLVHGKIDFVVGNYEVKGSSKAFAPLRLAEGLYEGHSFITGHFMDVCLMAWNKLCRRDFLIENEINFPEGLIHEDTVWHMLISIKANSIFVVQDATYLYRVRENSIMTNMDNSRHIDAMIKGLVYVNDYVYSHCGDDDYPSFVAQQKNMLSRWNHLCQGLEFSQKVSFHRALWHKTHFIVSKFPSNKRVKSIRYMMNYWLPNFIACALELVFYRIRN